MDDERIPNMNSRGVYESPPAFQAPTVPDVSAYTLDLINMPDGRAKLMTACQIKDELNAPGSKYWKGDKRLVNDMAIATETIVNLTPIFGKL